MLIISIDYNPYRDNWSLSWINESGNENNGDNQVIRYNTGE